MIFLTLNIYITFDRNLSNHGRMFWQEYPFKLAWHVLTRIYQFKSKYYFCVCISPVNWQNIYKVFKIGCEMLINIYIKGKKEIKKKVLWYVGRDESSRGWSFWHSFIWLCATIWLLIAIAKIFYKITNKTNT